MVATGFRPTTTFLSRKTRFDAGRPPTRWVQSVRRASVVSDSLTMTIGHTYHVRVSHIIQEYAWQTWLAAVDAPPLQSAPGLLCCDTGGDGCDWLLLGLALDGQVDAAVRVDLHALAGQPEVRTALTRSDTHQHQPRQTRTRKTEKASTQRLDEQQRATADEPRRLCSQTLPSTLVHLLADDVMDRRLLLPRA